MRRPGSPQQWDQTRMFAANMFDQQLSSKQVDASLRVDDQTVRRWRRVSQSRGREALWSRRHPGRTPRLDAAQRHKLAELLLKGPADCGMNRYLWTTQLIADLIAREFGVAFICVSQSKHLYRER